MKLKGLTVEHTLYGLAFGLALALRLPGLDASPLSSAEASRALNALAVARGGDVTLGAQPGYEILTGLLFFLLKDSEAVARFLPAVLGAGLAFLPWLFRSHLGRRPALVLAYFLALDPGLVAVSRVAGGTVLALVLGAFALGAWVQGRPVSAGIFAGLALLSGPSIFPGALGFGLALISARLWGAPAKKAEGEDLIPASAVGERSLRAGVLSGGGTLLLAGTLFLRFPQGIGALASGLPLYLQGWITPSGVPALRLGAALLAYQPLALVFASLAGIRSFRLRDPLRSFLLLWAVAALGLALLYPARQIPDLTWALFPLWALAALELGRFLEMDAREPAIGWGLAGVVFTLLAFEWLNLASLVDAFSGTTAYYLRWLVVLADIGLIILTTSLVSMGWSPRLARAGLAWGLVLGYAFLAISHVWGWRDPAQARVQGWWYPQPAPVQADVLQEVVADLSEWHTGRRDALDIVVLSEDPSLRWALRPFNRLQVAAGLPAGALPAVVIAPQGMDARLPAAYRGTDLTWWQTVQWQGVLPVDPLRWLVLRQAPVDREGITVWARSDLFLDARLAPDSDLPPSPDLED